MSTTTYTSCVRIERTDGFVLGITQLDKDITVNDSELGLPSQDITYLSAVGYTPTNLESTADNSVNNADLEGILTEVGVSRVDIIAGKYDFAKIFFFLWDYENDVMIKKLGSGHWGESSLKGGRYVAEYRSLSQQIQQTIGRTYNPECDAILGDIRCKDIDLDSSSFTSTVDSASGVTINDTAVTEDYAGQYFLVNSGDEQGFFTTIVSSGAGVITLVSAPPTDLVAGTGYTIYNNASTYMYIGTITEIIDTTSFKSTIITPIDGYFDYGDIKFISGDNIGSGNEVKNYTQLNGTFSIHIPEPFPLTVGDNFRVFVGCDKRLETCKTKFDNVINFQGFPYIPGTDAINKFGGQ